MLPTPPQHGQNRSSGHPKVLFISGVPLGRYLIGPAIRCWELARQVSQVADVTVAARWVDLRQPEIRIQTFSTESELLDLAQQNDVVVTQGPVTLAFPKLLTVDRIMVYDLYDPINLETLEQFRQASPLLRDEQYQLTQTLLHGQLSTGDFFLCANERQRDYWLGMLVGVGRVNPHTYDVGARDLSNLLALVPMGISPEPPRHTQNVLRDIHPAVGQNDIVLIWAGSLLDWLDPLTLIRAMKDVAARRGDVKLFFMASQHPIVPGAQIVDRSIALSRELGLYDRTVIFNPGWVPYHERTNYLLEADIGVTTHLGHLETRFSFRTRVLDYLWAGLPILTSGGDMFGDLVQQANLGRTVPPADAQALARAILELAEDRALRQACSQNVQRVAQEFRWDKVARPLIDFCRAPRPAPDLGAGLSPWPVQRSLDQKPYLDEIVSRTRADVRRARRALPARAVAWTKEITKRLLKRRYVMELSGRKVEVISPLLRGRRLEQSFRAYADNLSGIELLVGTFGRLNSCDVVLHVKASPDAADGLAVSTVNAMLMPDCAFCAFTFPPIPNSANRDLYFWVESPGAVLGDCVTLFRNVDDNALVFSQRYG